MFLLNAWVQIHSFKHNGSLHRYWEKNYVIEDNEDFFVVANERTRVVESDGRKWYTSEPAVTFFSKKDWFNVICMFKEDGLCYYCNLASPSIEDDGKIKYIDYDLDLKLYPDGNIRILDEKEYEKHRIRYKYDERLNKVLKQTMEKLMRMMESKVYPFDGVKVKELYNMFLHKSAKFR